MCYRVWLTRIFFVSGYWYGWLKIHINSFICDIVSQFLHAPKFCFSLMDSTVSCNLLVPHTHYLPVLVTDVTQYWPLGQCHYMILLLIESFWQLVVFDHIRCILRVIMSKIWFNRFLRDASLLFVHSCLSAEYLIYRLKHWSTNQNCSLGLFF